MRWARVLRGLSHRVTLETMYKGAAYDVLIALHARRSACAVFAFQKLHPGMPVVVALTGTDVYRDIRDNRSAQRAMETAARLVVLQPLACEELATRLRDKARVVYQSVERTAGAATRPEQFFRVCVAGHLRSVKDPFRAAMAVRNLPAQSRIRVVQAGAAMDDEIAQRVSDEQRRNSRYRWLGELPRWKVRRLIASSHVLVLSSRLEGGANVISEAVVDHTPVIASRIAGSVGLLGADYPGLYPVGDTSGLRDLLLRAESDRSLYRELQSRCAKLAKLFAPAREESAWRHLLGEL